MKPFAFYGRVSTEDQQDPVSSKGWQLSRSQSLIAPQGGQVVAEFFDIGLSRSLPWKRRPEALALLESFRQPDRGFEAVVIGEPARAFYGNQFGLTFPVFVHYGIELWVPEVGGRVDPGSDAHDLVMSLYGGMSKGERNRIKIRVRTAMAAQAQTEGRFLGGRPPYGYELVDAGPHPNPGKAAVGQRLHRLAPDPLAAPVVQRLFTEWLGGRGLFVIAEGLTRDGIPCPSAHDPARNRHRSGAAWSKGAVRAILTNPRYMGRQVWNRQRRDEVLIDVDDVALGHQTKLRWNEPGDWIWSSEEVQEPLVAEEVFARAQRQFAAGRHGAGQRKGRPTPRPYVLRQLLSCGVCGRRMQGNWNHDQAHYRCRFPAEYALANRIEHPRTVYLRESVVTPALDRWLAQVFDPSRVEDTIQALVASQGRDDAPATAALQRRIDDCDHRLARYRAALDAGADPAVVAGWMADVQRERVHAENDLGRESASERLTPEQIRALVAGVHDAVALLAHADPADKAAIYAGLGLRLTYHPDRQVVAVEADGPVLGVTDRGRADPAGRGNLGTG